MAAGLHVEQGEGTSISLPIVAIEPFGDLDAYRAFRVGQLARLFGGLKRAKDGH